MIFISNFPKQDQHPSEISKPKERRNTQTDRISKKDCTRRYKSGLSAENRQVKYMTTAYNWDGDPRQSFEDFALPMKTFKIPIKTTDADKSGMHAVSFNPTTKKVKEE